MSEKAIEVKRGKLTENIINADIAVVDKAGDLLFSLGDAQKFTYMRSCSKPVQALVPVEAGVAERFGLTERELSIMCASHHGESFHVEAVRSVLHKIGLDESYLQCGPAYSFASAKVTEDYIRRGIPPLAVINNCSGKHSAMLALCVLEGYSTSDYYLPEHPVQQRILRRIAEYSSYPIEDIGVGVDGCGVPVFAMPIYNMALTYARFADLRSDNATAARLCRAMTTYPEMIAGSEAFTSILMKVAEGALIAKEGADGVYCIGLREPGIGITVKCEDGNLSHMSCIAMSVLDQLAERAEYAPYLSFLQGERGEILAPFRVKDNLNCRSEVIGSVSACFRLHDRRAENRQSDAV